MKRLLLVMIAAATMSVQAQKVSFSSEGFAKGVRAHIGLDQTEDVLQTQTDTITVIDLSGLGIEDISDITYLPNVKRIDLSENSIEDVSPLASLEHLQYVNLKRNAIESINSLVFACVDELHVNVAENYISDFTYLFSTSTCHFILEGMRVQEVKDAPYWEVNMFYATCWDNDIPSLVCRGFSNVVDGSYVVYKDSRTDCKMDGNTQFINVSKTPTETSIVTLTNGEQSETTYVVPITEETVGAGKTVTLETGLPEDYSLYFAYASNGTVEIDGTKIKYTAPETTMADFIYFCYYQGSTLKGFSRCYVNKVVGDLTGDAKVDAEDFTFVANCIMGKLTGETDKKKADINGDGEVNAADLVALANLKKYGKITPPNGTRKAETDENGK